VRHFGALVPAAEALESSHPQAAAILYRALIDDILTRARSPAYGYAARYLARLDALADQMGSSPDLPDHETVLGQAEGGARTQDGVLEPREPLVSELSGNRPEQSQIGVDCAAHPSIAVGMRSAACARPPLPPRWLGADRGVAAVTALRLSLTAGNTPWQHAPAPQL
jgi:hypothetical protein